MKRLIPLLLAVCLLLGACGKKPEETKPVETTEAPAEATTQPTETTQTPTETGEPTDSVALRHPITGEPVEKPVLTRPVTMTINNIQQAMPQHGIGQADILHEVETEGGITRCLALFTDYENIDKIGAVRSARTYFVNLSLSYDAIFAHCGGSSYAMIPSYDKTGTPLSNWEHLDAMYSSAFFRDQDRLNSGYAYEHTLMTKGTKLKSALENKGYSLAYEAPRDYGFRFAEDVTLQGDSAQKVTVRFRGTKTSTMTYDAATGLYSARQYGKDWVDGSTGEALTFRNLVILKAHQFSPNGYHSMYDLEGKGEGFLAIGGQMVPITWERSNVHEPFAYRLADGSPVTFGVGRTYIAVSGAENPVSAE